MTKDWRYRNERRRVLEAEFERARAKQAELEREFRERHDNLIASFQTLGIDEAELRRYIWEVIRGDVG